MQSASLQVAAATEIAEEAAGTADNGPAAALEVSSAPWPTSRKGPGGAVPIPAYAEEQHSTRSGLSLSWRKGGVQEAEGGQSAA